jgi:uncharacterized protein (DUF3820 family)
MATINWKTTKITWHDGTTFEVKHRLPEYGPDNIHDVTTYWKDHTSDECTVQNFINFLNDKRTTAMLVEPISSDIVKITDHSLMPFGQHKGKPMVEVPAQYLLYIFNKGWVKHQGVNIYIHNNIDVLLHESNKTRYK